MPYIVESIVCRPTERRRPWQQQVVAQIAGVAFPLLTLSGACLGTQISLSSDNLPFGNVVLGSQVMPHPKHVSRAVAMRCKQFVQRHLCMLVHLIQIVVEVLPWCSHCEAAASGFLTLLHCTSCSHI